ncbi:MAG: TolC family protein [Opitutales bacterium]|nr:TolC family protein [Opitutales bacterium]
MKYLKFIILVLAVSATCFAQTKTISLTKQGAVDFALKNNLELRAVKLGIDEAKGRLHQSGRLENPSLSLEYGTTKIIRDGDEFEFSVGISQKFPLTNRLSKETDVSQIDVRLAEMEYAQAMRSLALKVELAYINAQEKLAVLKTKKDALKVFDDIIETIRQASERGEASPISVNLARSESARYKNEIIHDEIDAESAIIELETLLGFSHSQKLSIAETLAPAENPNVKFSSALLENRPDYQMFKLAEESTKAQIALIKAKKFEDPEIGIFYSRSRREDEPRGLINEDALGIALSIPLPFNSFDGSIQEKLASRRRAETLATSKEIDIRNEIRIWQMRFNKYSEALKQFDDETIALVKKSETDLLKAQKLGQTEIIEVLNIRKNLFELQIRRINIIAQQSASASNLKASEFKNTKEEK